MTAADHTDQDENAFDYEGSIVRLEEIVALLETHDTTLEQALSLYEEGVNLAKACTQRLRSAELRITELKLTDADSGE